MPLAEVENTENAVDSCTGIPSVERLSCAPRRSLDRLGARQPTEEKRGTPTRKLPCESALPDRQKQDRFVAVSVHML